MTPNQTDPMYTKVSQLGAELTEELEAARNAYDRGRVDRADFTLLTVVAEALIEIACSLKAIELKMTI